MQKIYLASPFFNESELEVYFDVAKKLRAVGFEVYVPQEHNVKDGEKMSNWVWGKNVFKEDITAINSCDKMIALNFGLYSDSGTAWEIGYAFGIDKPIINIICMTDDVSIMTFNSGLDCFYEDIEDWTQLEKYCYMTELSIKQK